MIVKLAEGNLKTKYGVFHEALYYDGQKESIAFYQGDLKGGEVVLCRLHSSCVFGHYLGVKSVRILTNNPKKVAILEAQGIMVLGTEAIVLP